MNTPAGAQATCSRDMADFESRRKSTQHNTVDPPDRRISGAMFDSDDEQSVVPSRAGSPRLHCSSMWSTSKPTEISYHYPKHTCVPASLSEHEAINTVGVWSTSNYFATRKGKGTYDMVTMLNVVAMRICC